MTPPPILSGSQRVNLEQLAHSIAFEKAQIFIHEKALQAWNKRGEYERSYTRHVYERTVSSASPSPAPWLENYLKWHKIWYEAEAEIRAVQIAQFKSHLVVQEAIMEEAKNPKLMTPGLVKQ